MSEQTEVNNNDGFTLEDEFFDKDLSAEGVWVDYLRGSRFKLASIENRNYKSALAKLAKRNRVLLDSTNDDNFELVQRITIECLAKHVLLGWENVNIGGVKNAPYTVALGVTALTGSSKLRDFITEQASLAVNFQKEVAKAVSDFLPGS